MQCETNANAVLLYIRNKFTDLCPIQVQRTYNYSVQTELKPTQACTTKSVIRPLLLIHINVV